MNKISALKQRIDSAFSTKVFYLFLLPFFFILFNLREIDYCASWRELFWPAAVLFLASFFVFHILRLILKSAVKSGILSLFLLIFVLFYSDIYFLFNSPSKIALQNRYIVLIFLMIIISAGIILFRSDKKFGRLNHYLNTLIFLICFYEAASLIRYSFKSEKWSCFISADDKLYIGSAGKLSAKYYPDIYLIIVDSYTSAGSLKKYLHYDNNGFIDSLKTLGFYTAANSKSNYAYTPLSLASLLNADYLPDFNSKIENPVLQDVIAMTMVNNSSVVKKLNSLGYISKNLSLFRLNGEEKLYTYDFLSLPDYTLFYNKLFCKTIFFWYDVNGKILYKPQTINDQIDSTLAISKEKREHPVFVYTHFSIPHAPFYFNKAGLRNGAEPTDDKTAYIEQLQYTNKVIYQLVMDIQKNSDKKSIILVMGDHGSRFFSDSPETASEDYSTLNTFYFPKEDYSSLYDSISHVNVFRTVLNEYFNEKLPRLEDKQDYWKPSVCN